MHKEIDLLAHKRRVKPFGDIDLHRVEYSRLINYAKERLILVNNQISKLNKHIGNTEKQRKVIFDFVGFLNSEKILLENVLKSKTKDEIITILQKAIDKRREILEYKKNRELNVFFKEITSANVQPFIRIFINKQIKQYLDLPLIEFHKKLNMLKYLFLEEPLSLVDYKKIINDIVKNNLEIAFGNEKLKRFKKKILQSNLEEVDYSPFVTSRMNYIKETIESFKDLEIVGKNLVWKDNNLGKVLRNSVKDNRVFDLGGGGFSSNESANLFFSDLGAKEIVNIDLIQHLGEYRQETSQAETYFIKAEILNFITHLKTNIGGVFFMSGLELSGIVDLRDNKLNSYIRDLFKNMHRVMRKGDLIVLGKRTIMHLEDEEKIRRFLQEIGLENSFKIIMPQKERDVDIILGETRILQKL